MKHRSLPLMGFGLLAIILSGCSQEPAGSPAPRAQGPVEVGVVTLASQPVKKAGIWSRPSSKRPGCACGRS